MNSHVKLLPWMSLFVVRLVFGAQPFYFNDSVIRCLAVMFATMVVEDVLVFSLKQWRLIPRINPEWYQDQGKKSEQQTRDSHTHGRRQIGRLVGDARRA